MQLDADFYCYRNGQLVQIESDDNPDVSLAAADSWLVEDGRIRNLDAHEQRFRYAIDSVAPDHAYLLDDFFEQVRKVLPRTGRWFPRIEYHRDESTDNHLRLRLRSAPETSQTVRLWTLDEPDPRISPRIKGPDLSLGQQLRRRANLHGADEAVLLTSVGLISECALSSLVWWRDDVLCAPGDEIPWLHSVTRDEVFALANQAGYQTRTESIKPADLDGLEIWVLSSLQGIRVVTEWSDLPNGPAVPRHAEAFRKRLRLLSAALD
jgi:branched-subunit amino acid aminotransferase/4-amino-4-deoxychorismate lyase